MGLHDTAYRIVHLISAKGGGKFVSGGGNIYTFEALLGQLEQYAKSKGFFNFKWFVIFIHYYPLSVLV